jgi:hypothetical protein
MGPFHASRVARCAVEQLTSSIAHAKGPLVRAFCMGDA